MTSFAEKILGKTQPDKIPLSMLVDKVTADLYLVFRGNGYKEIGFTLIAQDIDSGDCAASGNLKPAGVKALLESCLETLAAREAEAAKDAPPVQ